MKRSGLRDYKEFKGVQYASYLQGYYQVSGFRSLGFIGLRFSGVSGCP